MSNPTTLSSAHAVSVSDQSTLIVNKIILLATGAPGGSDIRDYLSGLYRQNGSWAEVAVVIDDYMNTLLATSDHGIAGLIQTMAQQAFGAKLSLADAQAVTHEFMANGIDSWSGLFAWLIDNTDSALNDVWNNRAHSANDFTDLLDTLGKRDDYNGAQAVSAAREWLDGIGASDGSMLAAQQSAAELIGRFVDGKLKGTAIDGYVAGATIFIDVNGNGVRDADEPSTVTDANGDFVFAEDVLPTGALIGSGGTDLATGEAFVGRMTAPAGSGVISPLTTLVQQMLANEPGRSQADVEDAIFTALGIPRVDLSSYDPIKAGLDGTTSREAQVNAAKIQAVTSQLINVLNVASAVNEKLAPGTGGGNSAMTALASAVQQAAAEGRVLSLSHAETVTSVVKTAAQNAGVGNDQSASLDLLSVQAGQALQGVNGKTQQSVDALTSNPTSNVVDALSDMYKLQKLTQTQLSPDIVTGTDNSAQTLGARFSGSNLDTAVSTVQAGNLTANTPTNSGNVTRPETSPGPDITPPVLPAALALALHQDTGSSALDKITSNGQVDFTLTALEASATWQYSLNGTTWLAGTGSSVTVEGDGARTVSVRQTDQTGVDGIVSSVSFTLDTSAAALGVALAQDTGSSSVDRITSNGQVNFDVSALENNATWQYSLNGTDWLAGSGSSVTVEGDGAKTVSIRQTDVAGNVSSVSAVNFTLDTVAPGSPTVSLVSSVQLANDSDGNAQYLTNDRTVQITGLEQGAGWEFRGGGFAGNWQAGTGSSLELSGDDGDKHLQVRQVDAAGNIQTDWAALNITLDTTAPEGLGVSLQADTGATDGVTSNAQVNFDTSALETNATWQYSLDGNTWTTGTGSSVNVEGSGNGAKTVSIRQTDQAGNNSAVNSVSFTLDTVAPTLTVTPVMASATTISLQANEAVVAGLYNINDHTLVGTTSAIAANTLGTITVAAQDSVTDTYIRITDGAGNSTTATVSGQIQSGDQAGNQTSASIRVLLGTTGNDTITGRDHTMNLIFGFDGDDELRGGVELQGNRDYIHGGNGNDRLLHDNGYVDTMYGGEGNDYIELDNGFDQAIESANEGVDGIGLYQDGSLDALGDTFENLTWLGFNPKTLTGNAGPNVMIGTGNNETINGLGGADTITGGSGPDTINGSTTVDTPDGADTYIYLSKADSSVNNTAITAFGFDVVSVTEGDTFDYTLAIASVTTNQYYVGQVPQTNGDALLTQLNGYFQDVTGGNTTGIHAMSVSIGNNQRFLLVDVNADKQINQDDLVIQIIEVTGISNHQTRLTLLNGDISFGFIEPIPV